MLEESRVYQVVPFMTHLELNHVKDDKSESQRAHLGQEAVKMINAGLQPEYRGRFKLQVSLHVFLPCWSPSVGLWPYNCQTVRGCTAGG